MAFNVNTQINRAIAYLTKSVSQFRFDLWAKKLHICYCWPGRVFLFSVGRTGISNRIGQPGLWQSTFTIHYPINQKIKIVYTSNRCGKFYFCASAVIEKKEFSLFGKLPYALLRPKKNRQSLIQNEIYLPDVKPMENRGFNHNFDEKTNIRFV